MIVCDRCASVDKAAEITAVQISDNALTAVTGYDCKNSDFPVVSSFCGSKGFHVQ